jgi:hypothetical protein
MHTSQKENTVLLIYKEIQMGAVAKSYMSRPSFIYDFATAPSGFPYTGGTFFFLFYQCMWLMVI